jgi:hypothetical protein
MIEIKGPFHILKDIAISKTLESDATGELL